LSEGERKRREEELERQRGITPEIRRYNEIKAGVITSCVGVGVMIFLYIFMQGIILGGKVPPDAAAIISRVWVAGVITLFVGLCLLINGTLVSKKQLEARKRALEAETVKLARGTEPGYLGLADTRGLMVSDVSVTEGTTRHLGDSGERQ